MLELTQMDSLTRAEKEVLEKYNAQNEDKKPVSNQKVLAETMKKAELMNCSGVRH